MTRQTETTRTDRTAAGTDQRKRTTAGTGQRTMAELSHTNPYTGRPAGQLFSRGPIVRADGGETTDEQEADPEAPTDDEDAGRRMKDVSHTPPKDADDANRVFERGGSEMPVEPVGNVTTEPVGSDE